MSIQPQSNARRLSMVRNRLATLSRKILIAVLIPAGLFAVAGCERKTAGEGGGKPTTAPTGTAGGGTGAVAVVNLDQVGRSAGWQGVLEKNLQGLQDDLRRQLDSYVRNEVQAGLEAKFKQVAAAAKLTPAQSDDLTKGKDWDKLPIAKEQRDELARLSATVRQAMNESNQQANQIMQERRIVLVNAYRDALRPVVRRVAQANNMSLVLTHPVDTVFYFDAAIDITDKVVDEVQKQNPTPTFPEPRKLTLPRFSDIVDAAHATPGAATAPTAPLAPATAPSQSATRPTR